MESRAYTLLTGLFVIGLVAGIIAWANWLAKKPLERVTHRVVSSVPVTGLNAQAQVRYRGISVGRVAAIGLDAKDARRILISIEVDKHIPLTRGTYAQLGIEGITGIAYVHLLDDGKDPQPAARAEDGVVELQLKPSFMGAIAQNGARHARARRPDRAPQRRSAKRGRSPARRDAASRQRARGIGRAQRATRGTPGGRPRSPARERDLGPGKSGFE
jgi:hypothetical protein